MSDRLAAIMKDHDDAELLVISTASGEGYPPEALAAAKAELEARALSPEALAEAEKTAEKRRADMKARAEEPVPPGFRLATVVAPGPAWLLARSLAAQGYARQGRELRAFAKRVMIAHVAIVVLGTLSIVLAHC